MNKLHIVLLFFFGILASCNDNSSQKDQALQPDPISEASKTLPKKPSFEQSQEFKDYWYAGKAEITSYKLEQARYGEIREGSAVLVFVTEDFLPKQQVKADRYDKANTPVLKLNATKNFVTGIYPYSIMQSTFYPVSNNKHALKVSCSVQEWCGHVYTQLNNRDQFNIASHSYFESDADENFILNKTILENELWTQLRLDPKSLPIGDFEVIPSMEFIRLKHVKLKAYKAQAVLTKNSYTLNYPDLERTLVLNFNAQFPYEILSWEETFNDGYGDNSKALTTTATKLETITSAYWNKKAIADEKLRETLQLNQ
ncbi:hypothetical protein [Psychroserpens damuponensis]|uniref:hypothetical protein n=1 Tax=Psychroserpens damuponensis TaxID=943936 RepID=UPI00058F0B3F|nr:hypothetical protein [Psychroserpens damuponensis]